MALYELVYGIGAQLSMPLELVDSGLQSHRRRPVLSNFSGKMHHYLTKLEEKKGEILDRITAHQARVKEIFDKKARPRKFMPCDEVILWGKQNEKKVSHGKFESLWKGPFKVFEVIGPNDVKLSYMDGEILPYTYNGWDLKLFKF